MALLLIARSASAQTVTDGDTIKLDGHKIRLWGIDAPELHQTCPDRWLAGIEAAKALRSLLEGHTIVCENRGHDRYGRIIGLCRADGVDVQAEMVRRGLAWAFIRYSHDYVTQEAKAREENLGIHAHGCEPAWEYRKVHR